MVETKEGRVAMAYQGAANGDMAVRWWVDHEDLVDAMRRASKLSQSDDPETRREAGKAQRFLSRMAKSTK